MPLARKATRLAMPRPWKDPKTGVWHLRQRTPSHLLDKLKGSFVTLPVAGQQCRVKIGDAVQVSLRTKDPTEAKNRHALADTALRSFWSNAEAGPIDLTHKQVVALSGTIYRDWVEACEEEPGSPDIWENVEAVNKAAMEGDFGLSRFLMASDEERRSWALEERFGRIAQAAIDREGLAISEQSRRAVIQQAARALAEASSRLKQNANGDYSPDQNAQRFPEFVLAMPGMALTSPSVALARTEPQGERPNRPISEKVSQESGTVPFSTLFDLWSSANAKRLASNTLKRYAATFRSLTAFAPFKARDFRTITGDDLHDWAVHRRDIEKVSSRSINKNDLVAVSSVLKWSMSRDARAHVNGSQLATNPAHGVRLPEERRIVHREKSFRENEWKTILKAANAVQHDPRNPRASDACRWLPWLAAYTGARITELSSLMAGSIRKESGVWLLDFIETKSAVARSVPIHDHLIELGFLDFVNGFKPGSSLFIDPARMSGKSKTPPAEIRSRKMAEWLRKAVPWLDMALQPDHAWRHTWKSRALEAGIEERLRDAICGHSPGSVGRGYEHPSPKALGAAMAKFPRYLLELGN